MKKFRLLLCVALLSFAMPKNLLAWNNGDTLHVANSSGGTIIYQVRDRIANHVQVIGVKNVTNLNLPTDGKVQREDVTFTITTVGGFYGPHLGVDFTGVQTASLPKTLETIEMYAFVNSSISALNIPEKVRTMDLSNLTQLSQLTVDPNNRYFDADGGVLYTENFKTLICCPPKKTFTNGTFTPHSNTDSIGKRAFGYNPNLRTLNIPQSVKYMGSWGDYLSAVLYCTSLTAINVDANNPYYCNINNDGVVYTKDKKTLVLYPPGKNRNGSYTVPSTVTVIDSCAFNTSSFTSLNLSNVEEIRNYAFYQCNLSTLNIPKSLKGITGTGSISFVGLATITVASGNTNFKLIRDAATGVDVLYSYDGKRLVRFPAANSRITSYTIASNTEVVDNSAFWGCQYLKTVRIPASVKRLEDYSFYIASLTSINFDSGSNLQFIGFRAFDYALFTSITLPASLETLSHIAFARNYYLKTVTVEANSKLKSIGVSCFANCYELTTFRFDGDCDLDLIDSQAFAQNAKLSSFSFPASVRYIGESAFNGCIGLKTVGFPADNVSQLDSIHGGAFANTAFTLTRIPSSVRYIGREAFWNVKTSPSLAISSRTDSISPEAFKGCYTLNSLQVDKANTKYSSIDGMMLTKDKETLVLFPPGKANNKFTLLAPSIRKIGDYAFYGNDNLTNVVIPNRVASMGVRAFGLCKNLNTMTLLCENFLDPANIAQMLNEATFDDGNTTDADRRKDIALHVRRNLIQQYQAEPFYDLYFKSISPSFSPLRNPARPSDGTNDLEEYIAVSEGAVSLLSANSADSTYVVPKTVNRNRLDAYSVAMVGDYVFHGCSAGIGEVVVPGDVEYVGAKAFLSDTASIAASTIKSVFLLAGAQDAATFSTSRFELDDTGKDYSEFAVGTKVYVKKSTFSSTAFQDAVKRYTVGNGVHPRERDKFSYRVPGIAINKSYGTFAREFDTDLSEYARELEQQYGPGAGGRVFAFTAPRDLPGSYFKPGGGDNPDAQGTYYVRMTSLRHTLSNGTETDGTYVPANTGVLLKTWDGLTQTDGGFFYCIGEDGMADTPAQSVMVGVTRRKARVEDSERNIFVMSGGVFKPLNGQTIDEFPIHKAYLKLDGFPGTTTGAKLAFLFGDDPVPTEVQAFGMDEGMGMKDESPVYDLQGRKVAAPTKGIYVRNGKKVIVK